MKFLSRLSLKNFSVFAVFLGIFIVAFPAVSVFAASQSPSDLNIFSITSGEQNKQLNRNCGYSTAEGLLAGSLSALEQIAAVRFEDYAEKVYCQEGDITGLFNSDKSTGVLGVLNKVNNTILAQRPASGVQFIEDKVYAITNPGVVHADEPPSYFPGTGFDLLQPIRGFWGWAVNLVFGVLVILIIFVAFAIIFRVKLPGNVTVTLQNSIPNIALAMILVPLSYAISGLFIDAITIGTNAIHDFLLGPASPGYSVYASRDTNGNDRGLYVDDDRVTWINARSLVDVSQEVEGVALQTGLDAGPLQVVGSFLNIFDEDTINANSANPGGTSAWLGTIINALLSIFMIWIGIKIFIRLFKKYITLMITPIFAPFVFATVAVPGNGTKAIMNFVKLMGSASLGFIVTYGMILLTVIFSSEAFQATIPNMNTGLWNPPLLGLGSFINPAQTIGGVVSNSSVVPFIMALISIGIYFSIPNVLDQIDQALGGNMSIPKFIMTPFNSFKESVNMTLKPVGASYKFRQNYGNAGYIQGTRARLNDRIRGYKATDPGGSQYNIAQSLGKQKYNYEDQRSRALQVLNDPTASKEEKSQARKDFNEANSGLASIDKTVKRGGISPSFYGEKDQKPKLIVEAIAKSRYGAPNVLGISPVEIANIQSTGGYTLGFDLSLKIEGNNFPGSPEFNIYRARMTTAPEPEKSGGVKQLNIKTSGILPFGNIDPVYLSAGGNIEMTLNYEEYEYKPIGMKNTIKIPGKVTFSGFTAASATALFGTQDPVDGLFKKGIIQNKKNGIFLAPHTPSASKDPLDNNKYIIGITINGVEYLSDPVSPFIMIVRGPQ